MHIKMLETRRGSPDGFTVALYHAGSVYDVGDSLGTRFVRDAWATETDAAPRSASEQLGEFLGSLVAANGAFRPQPTPGSAAANPVKLISKGIEL